MSDYPVCPFCSSKLTKSYLYVRGLGAAIHWSPRPDIGFLSRTDLNQVNLSDISHVNTGAQAIIDVLRCESCDSISFKSKR